MTTNGSAPTENTFLSRIDAVAAAGAPSLDAISAAVQRADYDQATLLALARAFAGELLPSTVVAQIIPGVYHVGALLALINASTGARSQVLLDVVVHDRLPPGEVGCDLAAILLYVSWRLGNADVLRAQMAWPIRRLLRRQLGVRAMTLVAKLVDELKDDNVTSVGRDLLPAGLVAHEVVQAVTGDLDRAIAESPRELAKLISSPENRPRITPRLTVRATAKPGRNDLCPCGSGRKYKRCCQDKEASSFSQSPISGLSWDEYLVQAADTMTVETIHSLSLRDLALVNLAQLKLPPLVVTYRQFIARSRWDLGERALDVLAVHEQCEDGDADDFRGELINSLMSYGEWDLVRHHASKVVDKAAFVSVELALALAEERPDALAQLRRAASIAVGQVNRDDDSDIALAYALLHSDPALGILVGRGCLSAERWLDSTVLVRDIEKARDRLNLPPGDPAWETWAVLARDQEPDAADTQRQRGSTTPVASAPLPRTASSKGHVATSPRMVDAANSDSDDDDSSRRAEEVAALQAALREASTRTTQLEQQLERQERGAVEAAVAAASPPTAEETAAVRRLQLKVSELKALINEGNEERRDLRRKLATTGNARATDETRPSPTATLNGEKDDDGMGMPGDTGERGIHIPQVGRRAEDALRAVPAHVAAEAMRTVGSLSAGDRSAWSRVKQGKDMKFTLLMARVGIHHRLLFRIDDGVLDVLDLVTRENLDTALKRLRMA